MKHFWSNSASLLALAIGLVWTGNLSAQSVQTFDHVFFTGEELMLVTNGQATAARQNFRLPTGATVTTNGVFMRTPGTEREMPTGKRLTLDEFWLADDGRLYRMAEHYMLIERRLFRVRDGSLLPVRSAVNLPNGLSLSTAGTIRSSRGRFVRLQDGQMIGLDGSRFAATDHVWMRNGRVTLIKDGSVISLKGSRLIVMSDGTRVYADGRVKPATGRILQLRDGQRVSLPGARLPVLR